MTTKAQKAIIDATPFAGRDLAGFFGTKKLADQFILSYAEARDEALREFRGGAGRATDCTFPEQFWDGRLFLDSDDLAARGIDRQTLASFVRDAYVEDAGLECDVHLIRNGRERIIVVDWTWKEDQFALDAWMAFKV